MNQVSVDEKALFDEISKLGSKLWAISKQVTGLNSDPKMFSVMLFKRLWSNHRGYAVLHNSGLQLEADIVLRSGVEAAICLAANYHLRDGFVRLMRSDTAYTLQGQIKIHRQEGSTELVKRGEEQLRSLMAKMPDGTKPARLNWKTLADEGKVPLLYAFHRHLSGISSHVTGMSVLKGVVDLGDESKMLQNELSTLSRKMHLMLMAAATLQGAMLHAAMIGEDEIAADAKSLSDRLDALSKSWNTT